MTELAPGLRVDAFTVEGPLATGGFGAVYRARDDAGRPVALKVLLGELAAAPDAVARFHREIAIVQRLRHPGVVEVLGVGRLADGRPYFAMELLDGDDLAARLAARGALPAAEVVALVDALAGALDAAHAAGIVHRDVKASNVVLCRDGRVVLLDFGIAKLAGAGMTVTASRQALGTPDMMAPEQLTGGAVDARTDVYGLGALAFCALTGRPPFSGESATVARQLHRFARRPRPSAITGDPAADDAVVRAMSIRPADRFASCGELAAALRAALTAAPAATVRALAVHVELAIGDTDPMPDVIRHFEDRGFATALAGSWSAVFVAPDGDAARDAARALAVPGAHVTTRAGDAELAGGRVTGGPLLQLADWPELDPETSA